MYPGRDVTIAQLVSIETANPHLKQQGGVLVGRRRSLWNVLALIGICRGREGVRRLESGTRDGDGCFRNLRTGWREVQGERETNQRVRAQTLSVTKTQCGRRVLVCLENRRELHL